MEMQRKWEQHHSVYFSWITASEEAKKKRTSESDELEHHSKQLGYYGESSGVLGGRRTFREAEDYHKRQYQNAFKEAIWYSFITAIVAAIILITGRYIIKGAKWVNNTSKKESIT